MSLLVLGDPHFSCSQDWRIPVGDAFLNWFEHIITDPTEDSLLCLGDFSDEATNSGNVIDQLERFAQICQKKFMYSFFLVGNHDYKLIKNKPQLSFKFVSRKLNIHILSTPAEITLIDGLKILSLPHYSYRTDIPPMEDFYSNLPASIREQTFDLVVGHFADTSVPVFGKAIDISYLKTQYIALGHIHTRIGDHYIGSVAPCKISELEGGRGIWKFKRVRGVIQKEDIPIPSFCEYKSIEYPNPLPAVSNSPIIIWTVIGCENDTLAKNCYPEAFIRTTIPPASKKMAIGSDQKIFALDDPLEVFETYIKNTGVTINRAVVKIVRDLLTT
jgi:hypothetical protein